MGELRDTMSQAEFLSWADFYRRWPFDDFHRFHRPAALIAHSMGGGGQEALRQRLDWLAPPAGGDYTDADRDLFRAAGVNMR